MQNSSPVELERQRLLRPEPTCGHFTRKHSFIVDSFYAGKFSVLKCKWTLCQQRRVVSHAVLVKMTTPQDPPLPRPGYLFSEVDCPNLDHPFIVVCGLCGHGSKR